MDPKHISDFFKKFKNLETPERVVKEACLDVVKKVVGLELDPTTIEIQNKIIYLQISSIRKSEVFLKKEIILEELGKKLPNTKKITDIR